MLITRGVKGGAHTKPTFTEVGLGMCIDIRGHLCVFARIALF